MFTTNNSQIHVPSLRSDSAKYYTRGKGKDRNSHENGAQREYVLAPRWHQNIIQKFAHRITASERKVSSELKQKNEDTENKEGPSQWFSTLLGIVHLGAFANI